MQKIIPFAHALLEETVQPGDVMVDATCGNGHDTVLASKLTGTAGHVYACDIQQQAIEATKQLITKHELENVTFIQDSHANLAKYLPADLFGKLTAAIFNLGYLPRSDKTIITTADSTIKAIELLLSYLKQGGRVVLVIYHGHEGGEEEKQAVMGLAKNLDQNQYEVLCYQFINQQNNPPFVLAIEKK